MKHFRSVTIKLLLTAVALFAAGCATTNTQTVKEDPLAAAKSARYLDGAEWVALDDYKKSGKPCVLPADVDKTVGKENSANSADWLAVVEVAKTCVAEKNWKTLDGIGNLLAKQDLDSPWGGYFLSLAAEGSKDYPRALWMIDMAQKKAGGRSGLFSYQKGRILYAMNEVALAMKEIDKANALDSHLAEGHYFLGQIYQRDLDDKAASHELAACLAIQPKHFGALTHLAELKVLAGDADEAAKLFQTALQLRPDHLDIWLRLGEVYENVKKDPGQALATYRELKALVESGKVRQHPEFDLKAKIKSLETLAQARVPAQASTQPVDKAQSVK